MSSKPVLAFQIFEADHPDQPWLWAVLLILKRQLDQWDPVKWEAQSCPHKAPGTFVTFGLN
jgi:hypothetical protein